MRCVEIDAINFARDRQRVVVIHSLAILPGPVSIPRPTKSLDAHRSDISYAQIRMQACAEFERFDARILDAQLHVEPRAAHRDA